VPNVVPDSESKKVDVTFKIISKNPVYANQILIQGNTVTDDSVIRREFRFGEGDAITGSKIRRSRQRLEGLDFFEKLDVQQENVAPDRKNVRVTVQEKQTGALTAAGGY
jgi:outer membrane protein insertion porin family